MSARPHRKKKQPRSAMQNNEKRVRGEERAIAKQEAATVERRTRRFLAHAEERVRGETRREERARAKDEAADVERAHGRVQQLYEISKLLTRFDSVERTVPRVLVLLSEAVPLRIAILMLAEDVPARTHAIVWHSAGVSAARLRDAKAHAQRACRYLFRPAAASHTEGKERTGASMLPSALTPSPQPEEGRKDGFILLPLVVAHEPIFGAMQVESGIQLDEASLVFVNAAVNQLAIALNRAAVVAARQAEAVDAQAASERAAAEAQRGEQRQRFLSEISALLSSSLEHRETLASAVRAAVPLLADACFIDEVADDGEVRRTEVAFADSKKQHLADRIRQFPPARDGQGPPSKVLRSGESVLLTEISDLHSIACNEIHAELLKAVGVLSMMCVPLVARGGTLGVLTFVAAESGRRYSTDDLALAEEVGHRAALAIDNARLYAQAQRAVEARQDLLSIVSHDLRNPLGVILMSSALLVRTVPGEERRLGSRKALERITRSAERMNRLIEDLLDLASVEAGRLAVERTRQPVAPLVQESLDLHEPLAAQKKLCLKRELPGETIDIHCDRDRVLQVFGNLIGNAIKFTPEGGTITVSAERHGEEALFSVADTGPGIASDGLPHVFDRYWQAKKTARLGTGLGLSIARGLVEAHGGRIWAESELGEGATILFTIPLTHTDEARPDHKEQHGTGPLRATRKDRGVLWQSEDGRPDLFRPGPEVTDWRGR